MDTKLVMICVRESLWVFKGLIIPYIETSKESVGASLKAFDITTTGYVAKDAQILKTILSKASR